MADTWTIKDGDGNVLNTFTGKAKERYVGTDWKGTTVASVEQLPILGPSVEDERREERKVEFSNTLDKMNPLWFNSLTTTQQANLTTWRTAWMDYPASGVRPDDTLVQGIF